jgi:hypothetical protein
MLSFSAAEVSALTPLPVIDTGNLNQELTEVQHKILTKLQKVQSIYQKTMDLVQKGYGAACKAYATAAQAVQEAQEKLNEVVNEGLASLQNLGKCGQDAAKKMLAQPKEDKKKCKEEFQDDADGYKKCLEDAKAARKVMKAEMIAECRQQMNGEVADKMAKKAAEAKETAQTKVNGIKNSFSWGKNKETTE